MSDLLVAFPGLSTALRNSEESSRNNVPTRKAVRFPLEQWDSAGRVDGRCRSEAAGRREKDGGFQQQLVVRLDQSLLWNSSANAMYTTQMKEVELPCKHTLQLCQIRSREKHTSTFSNAFFLKGILRVTNNSSIPNANKERESNVA